MNQKEFLKEVAKLRTYKKAALALKEMKAPWLNHDMIKAIENIRREVPANNKDIKWDKDSNEFLIRYKEISAEYGYLTDLYETAMKDYQEKKYHEEIEIKATEIKQPEIQKSPKKKKVTEIKGEQLKLAIHGGRRKGAGRKTIGIRKPVSINLPAEIWERIDDLIKISDIKTYSEYFRRVQLEGHEEVMNKAILIV